MFVSDNSLKSVKQYFNERLKSVFSDRELKMMFQLCVEKRLNLSSSELLLADDIRVSESDLLFFRSIVKRLQTGEPFQYVYGDTEFYGLILKTDARALIPRPETEELVDWIVKSQYDDITNLVDVCSGSGCIALALKTKFPAVNIIGWDVSDGALELARENAQLNNLEVAFEKLDVLNTDFLAPDESLDIVVSNPPYVTQNEKVGMQKHVLDFEPHLALFVANETPFVFYNRIMEQSQRKLKKGGWLYFEINELFGAEMLLLMQEQHFEQVELLQDMQGKKRMLRGMKSK
jgi:release factor glutamine methyltransferase